MVRIYCLSSINRIPPQEFKVKSYENGSVEEWDLKENMDSNTPKNLLAQRYLYEFYRLTEICIGYQYVQSRKVYAMNIFRKDCNLLTFKMVRGAVKLKKLSSNSFDLYIASSALFPNNNSSNDVDFDLRIRIRCIKNTEVKGIISKEEEEIYEKYETKIRNSCVKEDDVSISIFPSIREAAFEVFPFSLPNTTRESAIRTKISIFTRLIHLLCDPETGSYQNVLLYTLEKNKGKEIESRDSLDQELDCLLYNQIMNSGAAQELDSKKVTIPPTNNSETKDSKLEYSDSIEWEVLNFSKKDNELIEKLFKYTGLSRDPSAEASEIQPKSDETAVTKTLGNLNFLPNCLVLKSYGDCFLIAAVNAIEAMDSLKQSIGEKQNHRNIGKTQKELIKVLKGESKNVKNLRKTCPSFLNNEQEDAASALIKLIESLDKKSQNLVTFSYDTVETCLCMPKTSRHVNDCITLHLNAECQNTTFESMLKNWQKSNSHQCNQCNTTKATENFVTLGENQKFLIIEINATLDGELIPCSILTENGNLEKQLIFGALWDLTAAIQYLGDGKEGHYRTWKKAKDGWTVINDNQNWYKSNLLSDLKEYRVLVFKKLVVELIPPNHANDESLHNNDAMLHQVLPETQSTHQYQAQTGYNDNFNQPNPYQLLPVQHQYQNPDDWIYINHIPQEQFTYFQPQQSGTFTDLSSNNLHISNPSTSDPYLHPIDENPYPNYQNPDIYGGEINDDEWFWKQHL